MFAFSFDFFMKSCKSGIKDINMMYIFFRDYILSYFNITLHLQSHIFNLRFFFTNILKILIFKIRSKKHGVISVTFALSVSGEY